MSGSSGEHEAAARGGGLRKRVVQGSAIWVIAYGLMQVLRIGSNIVLAKLLSPAAFGLVTLGQLVPKAVSMFGEVGIKSSLVQNERSDEAFVNTAWTMQVLRGIVIALIAAALAWPASKLYDEPLLVVLIPALALTSVINGFESTRTAMLNRKLRELPRAMLELGVVIVTRGTMIIWAAITGDVWALVGGGIAGALTLVICSHTVLAGKANRFAWDPTAVRAIWRFGGWILLGTAIAFLAQQFDKLVMPKLLDFEALGVYGIAMTIARMPAEIVGMIATKIVFPAMSMVFREDADRYVTTLRKARTTLAAISCVACLGLVFASPWFFGLFYDERYADAMWIAPLGAGIAWIQVLNMSANKALLAMGESRVLALSGGVKVAVGVIASLVGFKLFGLAGFIIGVAVGAAAEHVMDLVNLARRRVPLIGQDVAATCAFAVLATIGWWGPKLVAPGNLAIEIGVQAVMLGAAGAIGAFLVLPLVRGRG